MNNYTLQLNEREMEILLYGLQTLHDAQSDLLERFSKHTLVSGKPTSQLLVEISSLRVKITLYAVTP